MTFLALYLVQEVIPWLRDFFVVKGQALCLVQGEVLMY